jgi:drug/metabolite transporter (DMT)-like permease
MLSMAYVVNAIAAWYLLGEAFNPTKLIGMGVIILGVIIISRA